MSDKLNIEAILKYRGQNVMIKELFGLPIEEVKRRLTLVEEGGLNDAYLRGFRDCQETYRRLSEHALKEGIRNA